MLTTRIVNFVGGHEGFVSTWYLDPAGTPTIGHGFTWGSPTFRVWWMARHGRKMSRGDTITKAESHQVLLAILETEAVRPVDLRLGQLAQNVREPAYSMVYNCGTGALGWKWAVTLARGGIGEAAQLWRQTGIRAGGKRLPGLVRRRNEEADIAEFDRWPEWVTSADAAPKPHVDGASIKQAQLWLNALGYECGRADGIPGLRTVSATKRFQSDHKTLRIDGIVGPATLAALQRTADLKRRGMKVAAGGAGVVVTGAAGKATGTAQTIAPAASDIGDWLLWGGLTVAILALAWLAWRYRDELAVTFKKL